VQSVPGKDPARAHNHPCQGSAGPGSANKEECPARPREAQWTEKWQDDEYDIDPILSGISQSVRGDGQPYAQIGGEHTPDEQVELFQQIASMRRDVERIFRQQNWNKQQCQDR
jgi:hypothetical protein